MSGMTAIDSHGNIHANDGKFAGHVHQPAGQVLPGTTRTPFPVLASAKLSEPAAIEYPSTLPPGGKVEAGIEDSGGVFVSITFEDQLSEWGEPVRISLGGDEEYSENTWNSITNGEPGFGDDFLDGEALGYLRAVHTAIDADAEAVRYAATTPHFEHFVARATGATSDDADAYEDEAMRARAADRGGSIVAALATNDEDTETQAADAVADILEWVRSQGLDPEAIIDKALAYIDED